LVRDKVWDYIGELMHQLEDDGELWLSGTRWDIDDPVGRIEEEGEGTLWTVFKRNVYEGQWPGVGKKFLAGQKRRLREWAANYELDPWAGVADADWSGVKLGFAKEVPSPHAVYLLMDLAASDKEHACYTAIWAVAIDKDRNAYLIDLFRERLEADRVPEVWAKMVMKHKPLLAVTERVAFSKIFIALFRAKTEALARDGIRIYCPIVTYNLHSINQKERIRDSLTPRWRDGTIYFCDTIPTKYMSWANGRAKGVVANNIARFPKVKFFDELDALSSLDAVYSEGPMKGRFICAAPVLHLLPIRHKRLPPQTEYGRQILALQQLAKPRKRRRRRRR